MKLRQISLFCLLKRKISISILPRVHQKRKPLMLNSGSDSDSDSSSNSARTSEMAEHNINKQANLVSHFCFYPNRQTCFELTLLERAEFWPHCATSRPIKLSSCTFAQVDHASLIIGSPRFGRKCFYKFSSILHKEHNFTTDLERVRRMSTQTQVSACSG